MRQIAEVTPAVVTVQRRILMSRDRRVDNVAVGTLKSITLSAVIVGGADTGAVVLHCSTVEADPGDLAELPFVEVLTVTECEAGLSER
jgi:hypothetical protein